MHTAFLRAFGQLGDPRIVRLLLLAVGLSVAAFVALWLLAGVLLAATTLVGISWLEAVVDVLGGLATLALTWMLFPTVVSAAVGLFLEPVAAAVEARWYPGRSAAPGLPLWAAIGGGMRFLAVLLVCNVLLLPCLLLGPLFPIAWYAVNGYLLGREYFELVALRRVPPGAAAALRIRHGGSVFAAGVVTALLLTVPFLNLVAPVVATMATVHLFERMRSA